MYACADTWLQVYMVTSVITFTRKSVHEAFKEISTKEVTINVVYST